MPRPSLRLSAALAVAVSIAVAVIPATAAPAHVPGYTTNCPTATSLVAGTHWWSHRLASGVVLREGRHRGRKGFVRMHVLTVDVTNRNLAFHPLLGALTSRHRLTSYSSQRRLIAATNAGYFDLDTFAPVGPVVVSGHPVLTTPTATPVVGFSKGGLMQGGHITSEGDVSARSGTRTLAGLNTSRPGFGITAYSSRWGRGHIALYRGLVSRFVRHGYVASRTGRFAHAPHSGYLLVARGWRAVQWLRGLRRGGGVNVHVGIRSDAPRPFRLAYAVGGRIVQDGKGQKGLTCPAGYPQPARTAVGFADGGRKLILVAVDDNLRTQLHGLDSVQLGGVMADLGATDAWLFDGGGSTTMVTRMHPHARWLSLRTRTADRGVRAVPLGFGIFRR